MNEYLIEDEYSVYEIDPECKVGLERIGKNGTTSDKIKSKKEIRRMEKSSRWNSCDCSFEIIKIILFMKVLCNRVCI